MASGKKVIFAKPTVKAKPKRRVIKKIVAVKRVMRKANPVTKKVTHKYRYLLQHSETGDTGWKTLFASNYVETLKSVAKSFSEEHPKTYFRVVFA